MVLTVTSQPSSDRGGCGQRVAAKFLVSCLCPMRRAIPGLTPLHTLSLPPHPHTPTLTPTPTLLGPLLLCSYSDAYTFLLWSCWPIGKGMDRQWARTPRGWLISFLCGSSGSPLTDFDHLTPWSALHHPLPWTRVPVTSPLHPVSNLKQPKALPTKAQGRDETHPLKTHEASSPPGLVLQQDPIHP